MTTNLYQFEARASDDEVKRDLELTCTECNEVLCDVEAGDTLGTLAAFVSDHRCVSEVCDRHGGTWGDDETCARCTFEDGTVRPIEEDKE